MTEGEGPEPRRARRRVRAAYPEEAVATREDVAGIIEKYRRLFEEQAATQFGAAAAANAAVDRFSRRMEAHEPSPRDHAVQWLMQRFREQCYREKAAVVAAQRQPPASENPTDPLFGELDAEVLAAVDALPAAQREAMQLTIAEHLTPSEIAARLHRDAFTIRMRLYRARLHLREQFPDRFGGVLGWLALARSLRQRLGRRLRRPLPTGTAASLPTLDPLGQLVAGLAVMVTMAAQPGSTAPVVSSSLGQATPAARAGIASTPGSGAGAELRGPAGARDVPSSPAARPPSALAAGTSLLSGRTAATEPPEDAQIEDLAVAPSYSSSHALVAVGAGRTCGCPLLLQTTDGGQTWASTAAPYGARQVVLPPHYPSDDRIFIGAPADGTAPDYVMYGFGGVTVPLTAPPGQLALAAGFGMGDDRVLIAGRSAVWSVDVADSRTSVVLGYPGASNPAILATAAGLAAVVVVVPTSPGAAVPAEPISSTEGIYFCGAPDVGCASQSSLGGGWTAVEGGPLLDPNPTVVGIVQNHPVLSQDRGHTFASVPLLRGAGAIVQASVAAGRVWGVFASAGSSGRRLAWLDDGTASVWHDVTSTDDQLARIATVVAVNGKVVVALLVDGALRCSVDGGQSWAGRCATG